MTASSLLADLAAWSAQVACIAVAGGLLPAVLRLDAPGVRYVYFRALVAICLILPWLQGRHVVPAATATSDFTAVLIGVPMNADTTVTPGFPWVAVTRNLPRSRNCDARHVDRAGTSAPGAAANGRHCPAVAKGPRRPATHARYPRRDSLCRRHSSAGDIRGTAAGGSPA